MQKRKLYRYRRKDGDITVSPNMPECEYETSFRLIADDGMVLTDTDGNTALVIDTDTPEAWSEVENNNNLYE